MTIGGNMYDEMTEWSLLATFQPKNIIVWVSLSPYSFDIFSAQSTIISETTNFKEFSFGMGLNDVMMTSLLLRTDVKGAVIYF